MIVFNCTQPLAKQLGIRLVESNQTSTGILGDWYATRLHVGAQRFALCLNERSLLPVIMPSKRTEFPCHFSDHLVRILQYLEIPANFVKTEYRAAQEFCFTPTRSKSLLGSLNDFGRSARFMMLDSPNPCDYIEANHRLTQMPSKPIDYSFPADVVQGLFSVGGRA
jgi:hypothetical protein